MILIPLLLAPTPSPASTPFELSHPCAICAGIGAARLAVEAWPPSGPVVAAQPLRPWAPAIPRGGFDMTKEEARLVRVAVEGGSAQRVVAALVAQTPINLVLLKSEPTPVTMTLRDVPLIEAVRHLCATAGLKFLRLPGTLVVGPEAALKDSYPAAYAAQYPAAPTPTPPTPPAAPQETMRTVRLSNVTAAAAADALKPIFEARGVVAVAAPPNRAPTLVGVDTGATGANSAGRATSSAGDPDQASRTLILSGPSAEVERAAQIALAFDAPRPQVRVDVTIHDVNDDALRDLGISWTFGPLNVTENSDRGFLFGKFDRTNLSASAAIRALETKSRAKLLAAPNLTVQDGGRGFVLIGDRLAFPVLVGYSQANTPIFDKQSERVGIYLQVGASVSEDGTVTMTLAPQVSTIKGFLEVNGASYPQISTREAQTTIRVKSGEAVVMGGLMRDEEIRSMERVPILGDLPVFGELFKRRKTQRSSSQLVITVVPTVVRP